MRLRDGSGLRMHLDDGAGVELQVAQPVAVGEQGLGRLGARWREEFGSDGLQRPAHILDGRASHWRLQGKAAKKRSAVARCRGLRATCF